MNQTSAPLEFLTGTIGLIVFLFLLALALYWLLLPFVIVGALKRIQKAIEGLHSTASQSATHLIQLQQGTANELAACRQTLQHFHTAAGQLKELDTMVAVLDRIESQLQHTNQLIEWAGKISTQQVG